ncbi:hypothetical protein CHUAL_004711 [Chamberlinius hualienensis]
MPQLPSFRKTSHEGDGSRECLRNSNSAQHELKNLLTVPVQVERCPKGGQQQQGNSGPVMRTVQSEVTMSTSVHPQILSRCNSGSGAGGGCVRYGNRLQVPGAQPQFASYDQVPMGNGGTHSRKGLIRTLLPNVNLTKCRLSHSGGSESKSMWSMAFPHSASKCSMAPSIHSCNSAASFRANCKLCLSDMPAFSMYEIKDCSCSFCRECMEQYVKIQILDGNTKLYCPDGKCTAKGLISDREVERLVDADLYSKYKRFKLNNEVDLDQKRIWCPTPQCENICEVSSGNKWNPTEVHCDKCETSYCSVCKEQWWFDHICKVYTKKKPTWFLGSHDGLFTEGEDTPIKQCPVCHVPIERDNGCAQMMCKKCKHVFCWYCLASLDDDFLLRHYDRGPCKNKLGHSKASIIWHRTQVIGIFAGFGILLLVASPLLLLATPCILCCKCGSCDQCRRIRP